MLSGKEMAIVYETLLSSPGMSDAVKINLTLSRKNMLLLSKVIEQGLQVKEKNNEHTVLQVMDDGSISDLQRVCEELLQKGGLKILCEKMQLLPSE